MITELQKHRFLKTDVIEGIDRVIAVREVATFPPPAVVINAAQAVRRARLATQKVDYGEKLTPEQCAERARRFHEMRAAEVPTPAVVVKEPKPEGCVIDLEAGEIRCYRREKIDLFD